MSLDLLRRLAIGLGALILMWIGAEIIRDNPDDGVTEFEFLPADGGPVDSIVIVRVADQVALRRIGDDDWSINGQRAATASITEFTDALKDTARADLVARSPTSFSRFEIADETARRVQVFEGSTAVLELLVGKRGREFESVYIRWPDQDEVYMARSPLGTFVDRPVNDWRDKRITDLALDVIAAVEVTRTDEAYQVVRGDSGQWSIGGEPADSAAVARLLGQFSALNGTGFPTEAQMDSVDLETPDRRVVVRGADDSVLVELVFDSTAASGYWVRRMGDSTILRLDRFRVDQLTPPDSTLRSST